MKLPAHLVEHLGVSTRYGGRHVLGGVEPLVRQALFGHGRAFARLVVPGGPGY